MELQAEIKTGDDCIVWIDHDQKFGYPGISSNHWNL